MTIEVINERVARELHEWTQLVLSDGQYTPWEIGRFRVALRFVDDDFAKRQPTLICIFDTATCASYFLHGKRGGRDTTPSDVTSVIQFATEATVCEWIASIASVDDLSLS
jgi:hypothetical protein